MIAAIPLLWRYIGGALILVLVVGGIYGWGYSTAKTKYNGILLAERAEAQRAYDAKVAENAALSEKLTLLSEKVDNELKPRLEASDARNASLADLLRRHQNHRCPMPDPARASTEPPDATGITGDSGDATEVDRGLQAHLEACGRDAERLSAFQRWYGELQQSFAAQ